MKQNNKYPSGTIHLSPEAVKEIMDLGNKMGTNNLSEILCAAFTMLEIALDKDPDFFKEMMAESKPWLN